MTFGVPTQQANHFFLCNAPLTIPGLSVDANGAFRPGQKVLHDHQVDQRPGTHPTHNWIPILGKLPPFLKGGSIDKPS